MTSRVSLCVLAAAVILPAATARAQAPVDSGAFVTRLGRDTVYVERYVRSRQRLIGDQLALSPRPTIFHYVIDYGPDGLADSARLDVRPPRAAASAEPELSTRIAFDGDSATIVQRRGDSARSRRVAISAGTVPLVYFSWGTYEQLTRTARRTDDGAVELAGLPFGVSRPIAQAVRPIGADSVTITSSQFGTFRARVDPTGRLLAVDARGTTDKYVAHRVRHLDFAARVRAAHGLGQLSPRDTVRFAAGGAHLLVDYGRPSMRGRAIFGALVPFGEVWRTGANAATQFATDRELELGGSRVPAGTYTLWTIPDSSGWTLIVNAQTGQWGTEYHADRDVVRVPMRVTTLRGGVERFTMSIVPGPRGGLLRMAWDHTRASVPFTVK